MQNKANSRQAEMDATFIMIKAYENQAVFAVRENKANFDLLGPSPASHPADSPRPGLPRGLPYSGGPLGGNMP